MSLQHELLLPACMPHLPGPTPSSPMQEGRPSLVEVQESLVIVYGHDYFLVKGHWDGGRGVGG